jgi:hypothetical protein
MAPIKFEEQLKDKLEKRTLSPSSESWSKLSKRLDADEQKSKTPIFWWLSIAAGIIILIAISAQFFSTDESEKIMPKVVEENAIEETPEEKLPEGDIKKSMKLVTESSLDEKKENQTMVKDPQLMDYKNQIKQKTQSKTQLADVKKISNGMEVNNKEEVAANQLPNETNELLLKNAVAEALKNSKIESVSSIDKEVDSLLKLASKELFKEKLKKETFKTVDASSLLISVEDEMGQSFRSKVFEALKDSYETVKTVVAERNF